MIRRFFRHIREGFVGVRRHLGMALSSSLAVSLTLLLVGLFMILSVNLYMVSKNIEDSISLVCLVEKSVSTESAIDQLKTKISRVEGVAEIEYRTKDQEFDLYNELYPEMAEFSDIYRPNNPFRDAFLIKVTDGDRLQSVKQEIESFAGVYDVEDGGSETYVMVDILQNVRIFGGILVIALCVLAVNLIFNTIKITIESRKDEIWIMRNVGAKNGYIRAPFLVEGIIIALIGVILPIGVLSGLYYYLYQQTGGTLLAVIQLLEPYPFLMYVALALLGIGVVVGFLGSYISVCKYLRLRR